MSLREDVNQALEHGNEAALDTLVSGNPRTVRFLVGMCYRVESDVRARAARGVGLAARHHPEQIRRLLDRLVDDMQGKSGANPGYAPAIVHAIAQERPELLLTYLTKLVPLAADPVLHDELALALGVVRDRCPGELSRRMGVELRDLGFAGGDSGFGAG